MWAQSLLSILNYMIRVAENSNHITSMKCSEMPFKSDKNPVINKEGLFLQFKCLELVQEYSQM